MDHEEHDFTKKYTMKIRPGEGLGVLAAVLLVFAPMLDAYLTVGLGIALLLLMAVAKCNRKS